MKEKERHHDGANLSYTHSKITNNLIAGRFSPVDRLNNEALSLYDITETNGSNHWILPFVPHWVQPPSFTSIEDVNIRTQQTNPSQQPWSVALPSFVG